MRKFSVTLILLLAAPTVASPRYRGGAVATAHPVATRAALEILDQGGNAVDATIAAALALAVVGPYDSGLGGGGFALVHLASGADSILDFREVAPKAATRDMFLRKGKADPELSLDGPLAVAVPGAARGYFQLHQKLGKLPLAQVAAPAIRAAREGFVITPEFTEVATERHHCLAADPEATRLFLVKGEHGLVGPRVGTVLKQEDLAKTLEALVKEGDAPFYEGRIARAIVDTVRGKKGILTAEDLAAYRTRPRVPLEGTYRGHRVLTMPPPSAGGIIVLQTLGVLERLGQVSLASHEVPVLHAYIEALRRAFYGRFLSLGDPAFVRVPAEQMVSKEAIDKLKAGIDPKRATPSKVLVGAGQEDAARRDAGAMDKKHTSHLSVIDRDGNAVSLTTTVNYSFGSCIVAKGTGIVLNDEMDDFAAAPDAPNVFGLVEGEANAVAGGKIPLSSMAPTLVFQKDRPAEVMIAVGSPGGGTIPSTVVQVISHLIDQKVDVARAVAMGRVHHQLFPDTVRVDPTALDPATRTALEGMGHVFNRTATWGNPQVVVVDPVTGMKTAASDPHVEGLALGQD